MIIEFGTNVVRQFEGLKLAEKGRSSFEVSKFESRRVSRLSLLRFSIRGFLVFIKTRSITRFKMDKLFIRIIYRTIFIFWNTFHLLLFFLFLDMIYKGKICIDVD